MKDKRHTQSFNERQENLNNAKTQALNIPVVMGSFLLLMLCGQKIGAGTFRSVYEFNMNHKKMVIKVEPNNTDCNITEYL